MIFLCGLFFPIAKLPVLVRPLSYLFPVTYGADVLHGAFGRNAAMPLALSFSLLGVFCVVLFALSLYNIKRRWITSHLS